ncbi:MAG: hypothetical protein O3C19_06770 [Bacteroidetes bacterium]|nr:hypothetical protein [Bacteroidota bacterium]
MQLKDQQAKLAIILINDYGYTKTTLVNEGVVALAIKEGVAIKDDTAN